MEKKYFPLFIFITIGIIAGFAIFISKSAKKYNVILISVDLLQAQRLNSYGYPLQTTPHLDKFFDTSYLFMNAIAPSSWTLPSAMSLFTSVYPSEHMMVHNKYSKEGIVGNPNLPNLRKMNPYIITFTEILKQKNYTTAAFVGGDGIAGEYGFKLGFDTFYQSSRQQNSLEQLVDTVSKAAEWLNINKNKSFFLFIQGFDLHDNKNPTKGYDYRYVKKPYKGSYTGTSSEYFSLKQEGKMTDLQISQEDVEFWRALYDEKINNADASLKIIFDEINRMGLSNNTVIVFVSNHGIEYYEHGKFNHGHSLYQELIHVPLAIRLPGQTKGKKIESLVSTMDVMPTILKLLNVKNPVPQQIKGINLIPSFYGKDVSHNVYSEFEWTNAPQRSIQTPQGWKLILTLGNNPRRELYNVKTDPEELHNLASKEVQITYELGQKLLQHINIMGKKI